MAAVDLLVRIKSAGGNVLSRLTREARDLNANLGDTSHSVGELDRNLKGAANATSNGTKAFAKMSQGLGGLVRVYAVIAANVFAATAAFSELQRAARVEQLTQAMNAFGMTTGVAMVSLTKEMRKASGSALDFESSMKAAAAGTTAGFSTTQIKGITKVATNASKVLGRDTQDSIDRLIRGLAKLEPELIDELGLMTRVSESTANYARANGKSAAQLTFFEKRMAFTNAVLEEGTKKYDELGKAIATNPYDQISASLSDLNREVVGIISLPIGNFLLNIGKTLSDFTNGIKKAFEVLGVSGETTTKILLGSLAALAIFFTTKLVPSIANFRENLSFAAKQSRKQVDEVLQAAVSQQKEIKVKDLLTTPDNPFGRLAEQGTNSIKELDTQFQKTYANIESKAGITAKSVKYAWDSAIKGGLTASKASLESLDALRASASNTINSINSLQTKMPRAAGTTLEEQNLLDQKLRKKLSKQGITDFESLQKYVTTPSPGRKSEDIVQYYTYLKKSIDEERNGLLILEETENKLKDIVNAQVDIQKAKSGATVQVGRENTTIPTGTLSKQDQTAVSQGLKIDSLSKFSDQLESSNGVLGTLKTTILGIKPAITLYRNNLKLAGIETESFGAKAEAAFLGVRLAVLGLAATLTKIVTSIVKVITIIGTATVVFDILKSTYQSILDVFTDEDVLKFRDNVDKNISSLNEFKETMAEISNNAIGFNNLLNQQDFTGAINQKYNSLTQIQEESNKQLQIQNKELAEGNYLLEQQRKKRGDIERNAYTNRNSFFSSFSISRDLAQSKQSISTTKENIKKTQQNILDIFSTGLNTSIENALISTDPTKRLDEFVTSAEEIKTKTQKLLPEGVKVALDDFGKLKITLDENYEGSVDLDSALDVLKSTLKNVIDKDTVVSFQTLYQALVQVNTESSSAIQNIRKSVLPTNDFLILRDSLLTLKSAYSDVNLKVKELNDTILKGRSKLIETGIPTAPISEIVPAQNQVDAAAKAEKTKQIYANLAQVARETNKVLSDDIITVGINSLDTSMAEQASIAITRFREIEKTRKELEKTIKEGTRQEQVTAKKKLEGLNADKFVQKDTEKYLEVLYGPNGLINSAIKTSNELALQTQELAAAQEQLNASYERFSLLSKLTAAGPLIDLDKQKESLGINKQNLDLKEKELNLTTDTLLATPFKAKEGSTPEQAAAQRLLFDESQTYAKAQRDAGLEQIRVSKVVLELQEQTNIIDRKRTLDIIEQDNQLKRVTNQQTLLNIEAEKYRGIIKSTIPGYIAQLNSSTSQIELENRRLDIESERSRINFQATKDAANSPKTAKETEDEFNTRINSAKAYLKVAQAEYDLTVDSVAAQKQYNAERIKTAQIESGQLVNVISFIDNLNKSKDINSEIFKYISQQTDLSDKQLSTLQDRINLESELSSIIIDRGKDEIETLKFQIEKRKALFGDTFGNKESLQELSNINRLELNNQRDAAKQRTQGLRDEISLAKAKAESFRKTAAINTGPVKDANLNAALQQDSLAAQLQRKLNNEEERSVIEERRTLQSQELAIIEAAKEEVNYRSKFVTSFGSLNEASQQIWYQIGADFETSIENSMGFVQGAANIFTGAVDSAAESFVDAVIEGKDILDSMKEGLRSSLIESIGGLAKDQLKQGLMLGIGQLPMFQRDEQGKLKNPALEKLADSFKPQEEKNAVAIAEAQKTNFELITTNADTNADKIVNAIKSNPVSTGGMDIPTAPSTVTGTFNLPSVDEMLGNLYPPSPPSEVGPSTDFYAESLKFGKDSTKIAGLTFDVSEQTADYTLKGLNQDRDFAGKSNWLTSNLTDVTVAGFASIATAIAAGGSTKKSILGGVLGIAGVVLGNMVLPGVGGMIGGQIGAMVGARGFANGGVMTSNGSMPLHMYAKGGVANSPQLAMFGEGRMPEAYVPLPDGRSIPVTMQGSGGNVNNISVNVAVDNKGNSQTSTGGTNSEDYSQKLGTAISNAVKSEIANQQRPGGLLYRGRR